jgi:hypothetical protein
MEGKINKEGFLCIKRWDGGLLLQSCPLGRLSYCGIHCPLFGEPINIDDHSQYADPIWARQIEIAHKGEVSIRLCLRTLLFDKFENEVM